MKTVFILFDCDQWNSNESKRILSVCTTKEKAVDFAIQDAKENSEELTEEDKNFLKEKDQTQGRETNYIIEETHLNAYFN